MRFSPLLIVVLSVLVPTSSNSQGFFDSLDVERDQAARQVKALEQERDEVTARYADVLSERSKLRDEAPELNRLGREYEDVGNRLFDRFTKTCGGLLTDDLSRCADPRTKDATRPIEDEMIANNERRARLEVKIKQHNADVERLRPRIAKWKAWQEDWNDRYQASKDKVTLISEKIERLREQTKTAHIEIETRILPPDGQAGMKSVQSLTVDFENENVTHGTYRTGETTFGSVRIPSIKNSFQVLDTVASDKVAGFTVVGRTASGVGFLPSIDYRFTIQLERGGKAFLSAACHDQYPAYKIRVNGRPLYEFRHTPGNLLDARRKLAGKCDYKPETPQAIDAWVMP